MVQNDVKNNQDDFEDLFNQYHWPDDPLEQCGNLISASEDEIDELYNVWEDVRVCNDYLRKQIEKMESLDRVKAFLDEKTGRGEQLTQQEETSQKICKLFAKIRELSLDLENAVGEMGQTICAIECLFSQKK